MSNVSVYDFRFKEYYPLEIDLATRKALARLQEIKNINEESLSSFLGGSPEVLFGIESLLRDQKFRNGQWIHFLFDVETLNRQPDDALKAMIRFNLTNDANLRDTCGNMAGSEAVRRGLALGTFPNTETGWQVLIGAFKRSLLPYVAKHNAIRARLANPKFAWDRRRIARYLIQELELPQLLQAVDLEGYLKWKKRPRDTKTMHGTYGQERLKEALETSGFVKVGTDEAALQYQPQARIPGIETKQGRNKIFDALLLFRREIRAAIETNFYESEGTKIGINVDEYIDLAANVRSVAGRAFLWVTDGPVWLTPNRRRTLEQLYDRLDGQVYNYNTLRRELPRITETWKG